MQEIKHHNRIRCYKVVFVEKIANMQNITEIQGENPVL